MTLRGVNMVLPRFRPDTGALTTIDDIERAYDTLQEAGGNAAALNPVHYCFLRDGTIFTRPSFEHGTKDWIWSRADNIPAWVQTISPDLVQLAIERAHQRGLYLALKPLVDPRTLDGNPGGWRGAISVAGVEGGKLYDVRAKWEAALYKMQALYAGMLSNRDLLIAWTEYYQIVKEMGTDWVYTTTQMLRDEYNVGQITYGANHGPCDEGEYSRLRAAWPHLDYVGISAYFPLVPNDEPPYPALATVIDGWNRGAVDAEWCKPIWAQILDVAGSYEKVVLTEIGFRADDYAAHDNPGQDPDARNGRYNPHMKTRCWQAFREVVEDKPIAGWFAWSWDIFPNLVTDPRRHVLNIPGAEDAVRYALAEKP